MGINNLGMLNMPFQKGNQLAKGHNGGLRKDLTVELITQLNEVLKSPAGHLAPGVRWGFETESAVRRYGSQQHGYVEHAFSER
jgi:hypothetical protein